MKLKRKHYKIAKTISYFVDRTELYFPDFVEPSEQQIELFFEIETIGRKNLTEDELQIVAPMMNGKSNYDLQIKMIYEELLDWMCQEWGLPPLKVGFVVSNFSSDKKSNALPRQLKRCCHLVAFPQSRKTDCLCP